MYSSVRTPQSSKTRHFRKGPSDFLSSTIDISLSFANHLRFQQPCDWPRREDAPCPRSVRSGRKRKYKFIQIPALSFYMSKNEDSALIEPLKMSAAANKGIQDGAVSSHTCCEAIRPHSTLCQRPLLLRPQCHQSRRRKMVPRKVRAVQSVCLRTCALCEPRAKSWPLACLQIRHVIRASKSQTTR